MESPEAFRAVNAEVMGCTTVRDWLQQVIQQGDQLNFFVCLNHVNLLETEGVHELYSNADGFYGAQMIKECEYMILRLF